MAGSATPIVYDIKSKRPNPSGWGKSFWPSIWAGMRNNPFSYTGLTAPITFVSSVVGWYIGNRETEKEVNPTNKATRVPNQFMLKIDPSTIWDDEIEE